MHIQRAMGTAVAVAAMILIWTPQAVGQSSGSGDFARTPGEMVNNGAARLAQFRAAPSNVNITLTGPEPSVWAQAMADSIDIVFQQLNLGILAVHNVIRARAGLSPVIPASILGGSGAGNSGTGGSGQGNIDLSNIDLSGFDVADLMGTLGGSGFKTTQED